MNSKHSVIETLLNLDKLIRIDDKRSKTVARKFAQCWLTHYPWPHCCIHDPGTEFTGLEFQMLLQNCHIRDVCTTEKNPQSNAVCERMHQTIGNILRTKCMGTYCQTYGDTLGIQNICTTCMETDCQYKIYIQQMWGQTANTKEYTLNIIDYHAWHESRSTLHFRQQPRQSCV
jgi:hypothetical protein